MKTLKLFTITFCLLVASFSVSAQTSVGVRGGISLSIINLDNAYFDEISNLPGIDISVPLEIKLSPLFALQPEFNYIQKGVKFKYAEMENDGVDKYEYEEEASASLNYLALPVFGKLFLDAGSVKFFLAAGPYAAYALNGNAKYTETLKVNGKIEDSYSENANINFNDDDGVKRFDFGLGFGTGASLGLGNGKIFLDARYSLGLASINIDETEKAYNRSYSFALGYLIPIK